MKNIKLYCLEVCSFCSRAKMLLDSLEIEYETEIITKDQIPVLAEQTGMYTAPQIFIKDEFIGGYTELNQLYEQGKLENMVK